MPSCRPPKGVGVRSYTRGAPKRRRRRKSSKPAGKYYECVSVSGRKCGVHHKTFTAAVAHRKRLDRIARANRARNGGRLDDWEVSAPRYG